MIVKPIAEVPKTDVDMEGAQGVSKQLPLSGKDGSPSFAFRVFTVQPGGCTPYHTHEWEHLNYIIKGEGALVDENGDEQRIAEGDFALVMPGEKHTYRNTSETSDLVMICAVPNTYA